MADLDTAMLKLADAPMDLPYDPHIHHDQLRAARKKVPAGPSASIVDGRCFVDVSVKLKRTGQDVPELQVTGSRTGRIVTGRVEVGNIAAARRQVDSLKAAKAVRLALFNSVPAIRAGRKSMVAALAATPVAAEGLTGSGVIVGIVDVGCDFRHANFRHENGKTRILHLWDQTFKPDDPPGCNEPFNYGQKFTAEEIDDALAKARAIDEKETQAYKLLGYTPPVRAHGTHVLDIAAGNGGEPANFGGRHEAAKPEPSPPGIAPKADIIFVHLKASKDGSLANSNYLQEAVEFIFEKAGGRPVVVNLSLSANGGPHDGTTVVEQKFEELLREPGRAIVVAAGNSFNRGSHLNDAVPAGGSRTILWHTDPRNRDPDITRNEMEVWYPGGRSLQVSLFTPDGRPLGLIPPGKTKVLTDASNEMYGRISHRQDDPNNHDNLIDTRLPHLENVDGAWRIELLNEGSEVIPFHAWIEQDENGQSRFEGPTDPYFTLGSISCSPKTLTVGAFDTSEMAALAPPFASTSAGPTRPSRRGVVPPQHKPELSAPGVGIVAARAHGGVIAMDGTSMAAAHVTGVVALLFELAEKTGHGPLPIDSTREILIEAARNRSLEFPLAEDLDSIERQRRLGAGSVDVEEMIKEFFETRDGRPGPELLTAETDNPARTTAPNPSIEKQLESMKALLWRMLEMMKAEKSEGGSVKTPYPRARTNGDAKKNRGNSAS